MTLEQALCAYLADLKPSLGTHQVVVMSWTRFREYCNAQNLTRLNQLAPSHVEAFQQRLTWEPGPSGRFYAANTVDSILRQVRNVARWATKRGHMPLDATRELRLCRPPQPKPRLLSWSDLEAILGAIDRSGPVGCRDAALFAILTQTRLGLQGCLELDLRDQAKLELEAPAAQLLRAYVDGVRGQWVRNPSQKALFVTTFGARIGTQAVGNRLDELARQAGVEGAVTPRMLWMSYRAALAQSGSSRLIFPLAENP
jgi:site-specific recombinase XerD